MNTQGNSHEGAHLSSKQSPTEYDVTVAGARLACEVYGDGPTLVQLHGLTSSRRRDEALELNLAEDVPGRSTVRYDARGHGRSSGRPEPSDYTWPVLADDLEAVLNRVCGTDPVDAIGQSMGAATLLHAAVACPWRFRTLTLVIPPTAWATRRVQRQAYLDSAQLVETHGLEVFARVGATMARPPAAPPAPVTFPDVTEALAPSILRGAAASDLPGLDALRRIEIPTLILAWVDDPSHPLTTSETLARALPNSELVIAQTSAESLTWGELAAEHITSCGTPHR